MPVSDDAQASLARAEPDSFFFNMIYDHVESLGFLIAVMHKEPAEDLATQVAACGFEKGDYYKALGWTEDGTARVTFLKLDEGEKDAFLRSRKVCLLLLGMGIWTNWVDLGLGRGR
jgi:hypothetical protein